MKVNLWGVRGSIPTTDPKTARYGGNTSCVDVWDDGWILVLDGGSGISRLQMKNELQSKRMDILLTHLHLDHIQGLGFCKYLFDPSMEIHIWGPASSTQSIHSRLSRYLSPPLFPVVLRDLPCKLQLHEIENSDFNIGPFRVKSRYVIHPGSTVGYRVEAGKAALTYIPDHEPALGKWGIIDNSKWISGFDLARECDLLYHDAQYSAEEYQSKIGWGHSSWDDAALFAARTASKHLLFAHHDPSRTDAELDSMMEDFKKHSQNKFKIEIAREGIEVVL